MKYAVIADDWEGKPKELWAGNSIILAVWMMWKVKRHDFTGVKLAQL